MYVVCCPSRFAFVIQKGTGFLKSFFQLSFAVPVIIFQQCRTDIERKMEVEQRKEDKSSQRIRGQES